MHHRDHLTTAEVAELLGCHVATVNRMAKTGRLVPVNKLPGRTGANLFAHGDVLALLEVAA